MRSQKGLSLIELMISLTLGIVLMTGVMQMFLTSRMTYSTQQGISSIQESGRMAMDFLAEDIRMAGYMGCSSRNPNLTNGLEASGNFLYDFSQMVVGYASDTVLPGVNNVADDTDILVIRRASDASVHLVQQHNAGSNANFRIDEEPVNSCLFDGQLCDDNIAIISDCSKGRIFRAVNVQDSSGGGAEGLVVHSNGGSTPTNIDSQLGGQQFGVGSEIMAFNTIVYFIAPSAFQGGGAQVRSLWKKVGERDAVELIEGVERMRLQFGVSDGSGTLDRYEWREDMVADDWANVIAVRAHLLATGLDNNVLPEPQVIQFAGEALSADLVADRRMRQVFTSTVGVRGRLD
ncbi:PilW family protein [Marinimicrobium sp. C6131]|uniref:PilW family protein n=1 Tax=Marinimicrobium sp. C6131 TaxID=3022676 RepID=UPI00223D6EC0|nr:PilW family protein [Marinimicrobium sp. C6131]UZJ44688.1 PilW family protein [Marinimicrobium sp. C6131]